MAIQDQISGFLPSFSGGGILTVVMFFVIIIILIMIGALVTYFVIMALVYNKRIVIFEKIGGRAEVTIRAKAREVKVGDGGDTAFYIQRVKKFVPTPTIQTGRRTYWYYKRNDGELINIGISDIDEQMRVVKAHFLDKEMRYSRTALQRNMRERYDKLKFWDKYGGLIMYTVLIAITGIMVYLLFDKFIEVSSSVASAVNSAKEVLDASRDLLLAVDNVQSGSGGIVPA